MSDEDLLRRAAERLREVAEAATPGPWVVSTQWHDAVVGKAHEATDREEVAWYGGAFVGESLQKPNRHYLMAMHPPVALALADLLDQHVRVREMAAARGLDLVPEKVTVAETLARAVLREDAS